jgi:hypothetical protein
MSEGAQGLLVLFTVALVTAVAWHWVLCSFPAATLVATATAVVLFQVVAYAHLGYLDPFFMVAVATSSVVCFVVSLLVGWAFVVMRRRKGKAYAL